MTISRYDDACKLLAREQARTVERALTMVLEDEDRHRRDVVLIALDTMRVRLAERGVAVAPQEVLTVLEEVTGTQTRGKRLPVMLADARNREQCRRTTDPRELIEQAARSIEAVAPPRNARTPE